MWRIADLYLNGTISELAKRRSEFASILQRQGVDGLIAELNRKSGPSLGYCRPGLLAT
jgi:phospholipid transport system substrate-binding protein